MENDGLIEREARYIKDFGQVSNRYRLDGLIKSATPYAEEIIEERGKRKKEDAARRTRKRRKFKVVDGTKKTKI